MTIEIKTPTFPESITDGTVAAWHKAVGEDVRRDELLVDIETDKVVLEVVAPANGVLSSILKNEGDIVESEEVLAVFSTEVAAQTSPDEAGGGDTAPTVASSAEADEDDEATSTHPAPSARKLADEQGIDLAGVTGTGRGGRVTKEDVQREIDGVLAAIADGTTIDPTEPSEVEPAIVEPVLEAPRAEPTPVSSLTSAASDEERVERRVPMTRLRASIARRLVEAQQTAAMLTTFNEVDMLPVMTMRRRYGEEFQARHNGTKLGFMSFFVRASVEALKRFPSVNASIDGNDVIYHGYYDIGVAVSSERGLVVPVIRDADALGMHQIEDAVAEYGEKAQTNKLAIEDMAGGTFTISNGGVFGSLMSTPILNPPQTGILGMHKIEDRAIVVDGEVVVRPMMYLALSYDHRLIDGQEAVRFLVTIKELIEDPARILLEL